MSKRILVAIPTYNERGNVERLADRIIAQNLGADILFVDDNSPDGTGDLLNELAERHDCLKVVHRTGKEGVGSAHKVAIKHAYDNDYDLLITMDSDFTHSPEDLPRLVEQSEHYDIVVGSRFKKLGSLPGWNFHRRMMTMAGHLLTRFTLSMPYDASGAMRIYKLSAVPREIFNLVRANGYDFFLESLFIIDRNRLSIGELPIILPARTYGTSKMRLTDALLSATNCFALRYRFFRERETFMWQGRSVELKDDLVDPQNWNDYWSAKSDTAGFLYDIAAATYRQCFIRPFLNYHLRGVFTRNSKLLHAGCGAGKVDVDIQCEMNVTGLDISPEAVKQYSRNNPRAETIHGSIFEIPAADKSYEGIYNLGVMEHFTDEEIEKILAEFKRVLNDNGKLVLFWPHRFAPSVWFLKCVRFILGIFKSEAPSFHPAEITYCRSKRYARELMNKHGLELLQYTHTFRDLYIQSVIVARKKPEL